MLAIVDDAVRTAGSNPRPASIRPARRLSGAVALVLLAGPASTAPAEEAATLVNKSNHNIEFYVKWANLPNESPKFVLAPDERRQFHGANGDALYIRFNSTPRNSNPPRERRERVITFGVPNPRDEGKISYFKNVNADVVDLYDRP